MKTLVTGIVAVLIVHYIDACTFPADLTGTWKHSYHGNVNFQSNTVMQFTETLYGTTVNLKCDNELITDSKFIVISDAFLDLSSNSVVMKICMEFTLIRTNLYKVIHRTVENSKADYSRTRVTAASDSDNSEATVCSDSTSEPDAEYYLLMKSSELANVKVDFPTAFQGKISYTFDSTFCSGNSGYADICTDKTLLDINYNQCNTVTGYTSSGHLNCLYYTSSSGTYTIWTYNQDSSVDNTATYYFTCFKVQVTGTTVVTVSATQNPYFCDATQTATAVSTGSKTLGKTITGTSQRASAIGRFTGYYVTIAGIMILLLNWV